MNITGVSANPLLNLYRQNGSGGQSAATDGQNTAYRHDNADKVSLSQAAKSLANTTPDGMPAMQFNAFGGPPHMLPPQGAGAIEEFAYRRSAIAVDTTIFPHEFSETGKALNYADWLAQEKEIDKIVQGRVALYTQSKAQGLSDEQILQRLNQYNDKLPAKYQLAIGEPYGDDYRVPYSISQASLSANLNQERHKAFEAMYNSYT